MFGTPIQANQQQCSFPHCMGMDIQHQGGEWAKEGTLSMQQVYLI